MHACIYASLVSDLGLALLQLTVQQVTCMRACHCRYQHMQQPPFHHSG